MRSSRVFALACVLSLSCIALAAEEPAPDGGKKEDGAPPAPGERGNRGRRDNNPGGGGGERDRWRQMGEQFINNMAGPGGPMGPGGIFNPVASARALGIDIEGPKSRKIESLPLNEHKRLVLNVPVGGVDIPGSTGSGWKVENVFKLSEEQTTKLETLRTEYAAEQKKLEDELNAQNKAMAAKVAELRKAYEAKANDLLSPEDKEAKLKLDALGAETATKNTAVLTDGLKLYDPNDVTQGMALLRMYREKSNDIATEQEQKLLNLVPAASREVMETLVKNNAAARQQMQRPMQGRRGGRGNDDPMNPPRPPDGNPNF
jgi:hypothetical protein